MADRDRTTEGAPPLVVPRILATGAAVTAATAVRIGVRGVGLVARRTPRLAQLVASALGGDNRGRSQAELRDEVMALLRDSAEASWLEMRRGVDEFDVFTRSQGNGTEPSRPYRVKP